MKAKIKKFTWHWFKSLDILKRQSLSERYSDESGDPSNFVEGFTNEFENWLVDNYDLEIKEYIIDRLVTEENMKYIVL